MAASHVDAACRWLRGYEKNPKDRRFRFTSAGSVLPFFSSLYVLEELARDPAPPPVFPYLAKTGNKQACPIHAVKNAGRKLELVIHPFGPSQPVVVRGPDGQQLADVRVQEVPSHRSRVRRIVVPAAHRPGTYRVSLGPVPFLVIGGNAEKLVFSCPQGARLGTPRRGHFVHARGKPYYFRVPRAKKSFALELSEPVTLRDPSGEMVRAVAGRKGRLEIPVAGRAGLWSFVAGNQTFVKFEGVPPVVAFGEPGRFFLPDEVRAQPH